MKWIAYLFSSLWRFWFLLVFIFVFIIFIPCLFLFTAIIKKPIIVSHLARYWAKILLWGSFIFPRIELEEKLNPKECYIFCPNHVSTLDIPFILASIPTPLQFMGKAELIKIPLFGWFFKNNAVIVNRNNIKDSYSAFLNAGKKLDKGISMCIFPEGGIPQAEVFLRKFKNGPFKLAIEKQISIVPITMPDNKQAFPQEYYKGMPGIVKIKIHSPIKVDENKTLENLNSQVYNTIFEQLKNYEN